MPLRPSFRETSLNFQKPNQEFATLQNVVFDLRTSDGTFADIKSVAIEKRLGSAAYGNEISATGELHTLLSYTNKTYDYLISGHSHDLYKFVETTLVNSVALTDTVIDLTSAADFAASGSIYIGDDKIDYTSIVVNQLQGVTGISETHLLGSRVVQRIWKSIKSGLSGDHFTGAVMESYSGAVTITGTVVPAHTGTWTAVAYDPNTGYTTLTNAGATPIWEADALINRKVKVNTGDYPDTDYTIVENGTTYVRVEGDIAGAYTTSTTVIGYTTTSAGCAIGDVTINLTSAADFPAGGGTINIEDDLITYTGKAVNQLTGVSGISVGHASGSICFMGEVTLASVSGFGQNGAITVGTSTIFYNNKSGNKLLNLSCVPSTLALGSVVKNSNYRTGVGKAYSIEFTTVSTRLVNTSASWVDDAYANYTVHLYQGTGAGQQRMITSNKKDYMEVAFSWEQEPDATTKYNVYQNTDQVLYMGNKTDEILRYDGSAVTEMNDAPRGNIVMAYQSRLFIANGYTVYYSDVGDPEYFPPMYTITPPGDDQITGLGEWNGNGIIFKERSIWKYNFSFNSTTSLWDIDLVQIPASAGAVSHRSIQKVENVLWYYDGDAIMYLGASPNQIGVIRTDDISFPIYQGLANIDDSMKSSAVSVYDGSDYLMFTTATSDSEYNDFGYDYDTKYSAWSTRTGNYVSSVVIHRGVSYYGDSRKGQVVEMNVEDVYTDSGIPVDMVVETKDTDLGNPGIFKTFRFGIFGLENEDSSVEYKSKVYTTRYTLTREGNWDIGFGIGTGSTLGSETTLGLGAFGASSEAPRRVVKKVSMGLTGTRVQHKLRNNKNEKLTITDISTVWYARSMRHFPSVLIS